MAYFGQKVIFSVSDVSERFKESISRFPANFKKISESRIFDLYGGVAGQVFFSIFLNFHFCC